MYDWFIRFAIAVRRWRDRMNKCSDCLYGQTDWTNPKNKDIYCNNWWSNEIGSNVTGKDACEQFEEGKYERDLQHERDVPNLRGLRQGSQHPGDI